MTNIKDKFNVNYINTKFNKLEKIMINWNDNKKSNKKLDNLLQPKNKKNTKQIKNTKQTKQIKWKVIRIDRLQDSFYWHPNYKIIIDTLDGNIIKPLTDLESGFAYEIVNSMIGKTYLFTLTGKQDSFYLSSRNLITNNN